MLAAESAVEAINSESQATAGLEPKSYADK